MQTQEEPFNNIFLAAAEKGDLDRLRTALSFHLELIDCPDPESKKTPLHVAAEHGQTAVIDELIRSGSQALDLLIQMPRGDRRTPLHLAAEYGHLEAVELLVRLGSQAVALLSYDHSRNFFNEPFFAYGFPGDVYPIHLAAMNGHTAVVEALFRLGSPIDVLTTRWENTPIYLAAYFGHAKVVELLHSLGSNGIAKENLVSAAARGQHLEVLETLVRLGCDPDETDCNQSTPLHEAISRGDLKTVEALIRLGTRAFDRANRWGKLPLHLAAEMYTEMVDVLLRASCQTIDAVGPGLRTPLHLAASRGCVATVELLCRSGSRAVDVPDELGKTPLYAAVEIGNVELIETLLRYGSRAIDTPAHDSWTPMLRAAQKGNPAVIEVLVYWGATTLDTPTHYGRTPMYLAAQYAEEDKIDAVRVLKALGANSDIPTDCLSEKATRFLKTTFVAEDEVRKIRFRTYFRRTLANRLLFLQLPVPQCAELPIAEQEQILSTKPHFKDKRKKEHCLLS